MTDYILGIDIGGTFIKAGIFSISENKLIEKKVIPTEKKLDRFLNSLTNLIKSFSNKFLIKKCGIGFPGNISPDGVILFSPHIPNSVGFNFSEFLHECFEIEFRIDNDANLSALAHFVFGREKVKDLICLTLGTGIGGGAIVNGKLFSSAKGLGAEFGHICVVPDGDFCSCGKRGCMEAYSSSSGMINRYGDKFLTEFKELYKLLKNGDKRAKKVIEEGFYFLGIGVGSLINIFAPEVVYFAGGVSNVFNEFREFFIKGVNKTSLKFLYERVKFLKSELDDAGILGAVALWI